jgi:hypothetical protein
VCGHWCPKLLSWNRNCECDDTVAEYQSRLRKPSIIIFRLVRGETNIFNISKNYWSSVSSIRHQKLGIVHTSNAENREWRGLTGRVLTEQLTMVHFRSWSTYLLDREVHLTIELQKDFSCPSRSLVLTKCSQVNIKAVSRHTHCNISIFSSFYVLQLTTSLVLLNHKLCQTPSCTWCKWTSNH